MHRLPFVLMLVHTSTAQKTEAEIKEARAKAARDLVNIDEPERKRRVIFGSVLLVRALTPGPSSPQHARELIDAVRFM